MKTLSPVWRLFGPLLAANLLLITTNARDIYVDSNYAGANPDGTKTAPFRRFTRAYQDAKPGDTIFVAPGDYPDPGDFGLPEGDSRGIVVKHWGAPAVIGRFSPVPVGPDGEWADSDSDGMPDVFERRNELDPKSAADALRDRDGDGLTNLEEYERDTKIDVSNFTGGLTGQFAVDPSGSASVSIPITVPPGTAGMQPNLSLVINSRGGPGVVGLGGSIAGIPSITRGEDNGARWKNRGRQS
jgi:hypothetical protein